MRVAPTLYAGLLLLTLVAFWPGYVAAPSGALSGWHHLHAATGFGWIALLIAQPLLARQGLRQWHRLMGGVGVVVMTGLMLGFVLLGHHVLQGKSGSAFALEAYLSYLRLVEAALVLGCFTWAVLRRLDPILHPRWMFCSGLPLIDPVVHRIAFRVLQDPGFSYQLLSWTLIASVLAVMIWLDRGNTRGRRVYGLFLALLTLAFIPPVFEFWTWGTPWQLWKAAVQAFATLPLPS